MATTTMYEFCYKVDFFVHYWPQVQPKFFEQFTQKIPSVGPFQANVGPFQANVGPFQPNVGPFQANVGPFQANEGPFQANVGPFHQTWDHFRQTWDHFIKRGIVSIHVFTRVLQRTPKMFQLRT